MKYKEIILLLLFAMLLVHCDEEVPFPQVKVDFTLDLNDPEYRTLLSVGSVATVVGGSRGIILKRTGYDTFSAFDQHCTYDPDDKNAKVSLEEGGISFAICESCKTKYNLYFGNVEEGPGSYPLVDYRAVFYPNSNRLRVYN